MRQCFALKILTLTGCTPDLVVFVFLLILYFSLMFFIHWLWVMCRWLLAITVHWLWLVAKQWFSGITWLASPAKLALTFSLLLFPAWHSPCSLFSCDYTDFLPTHTGFLTRKEHGEKKRGKILLVKLYQSFKVNYYFYLRARLLLEHRLVSPHPLKKQGRRS